MSAPYAPTAFDQPALNPAVGGAGVPIAYVSNSQYQFAPTAMDTGDLVPGGTDAEQAQSLADVLARASAWADRYCFGADPAAKGSSLAATVSVESARVALHGGELRLACDYKPIVSVLGVDVGPDMASLRTIGTDGAARIRFGRRTIYVPASTLPGFAAWFPFSAAPQPLVAVWSYVNGYPHTTLADSADAGDTTVTVTATDGDGGIAGVLPGTRLTIYDGADTETVTVTSASGTTLTVTALANAHTPPAAPDFTPVTALPADVTQAVIFLATALIKTRGDNSLVLDEITEPRAVQPEAGDEFTDVALARRLLAPYRVRVKDGR